MREMLFRGKTVYTNKWVKGFLVIATDAFNSAEKIYFIFRENVAYHGFGGFDGIERVIPETVGQYTGLTDKNGKKIFEGDIVYVCYKGKNGAIVFKHGTYLIDGNGFCIDFILTDRGEELEIIGNIHDNPELLKGGVENV